MKFFASVGVVSNCKQKAVVKRPTEAEDGLAEGERDERKMKRHALTRELFEELKEKLIIQGAKEA